MKLLGLIGLVVGIGLSSAVWANGKALHDAACMQCHTVLMEGDSSAIYTRGNRKVQSFKQLEQQVARCALVADTDWSANQRQQVVEYLAQRFYPF